MAWQVTDRWNNEIILTEERWQHIIDGHWELADLREQVLEQFTWVRASRVLLTPISIDMQDGFLVCRTGTHIFL